jgi:hypothetical protein
MKLAIGFLGCLLAIAVGAVVFSYDLGARAGAKGVLDTFQDLTRQGRVMTSVEVIGGPEMRYQFRHRARPFFWPDDNQTPLSKGGGR